MRAGANHAIGELGGLFGVGLPSAATFVAAPSSSLTI
jgi:hypothetical protein